MVIKSFGQNGNSFIQRGFVQNFGQEGFDQGKYSGLVQPYILNNGGQGYNNLGWNGLNQGTNIFNPYQQKLSNRGYQNQGFNVGGGLGGGFVDGGQLFGVPQPANFVGNQRIRIL